MIRALVSDAAQSAAIGDIVSQVSPRRKRVVDAAFLEAVIDIGLDGARRSSSKRESA